MRSPRAAAMLWLLLLGTLSCSQAAHVVPTSTHGAAAASSNTAAAAQPALSWSNVIQQLKEVAILQATAAGAGLKAAQQQQQKAQQPSAVGVSAAPAGEGVRPSAAAAAEAALPVVPEWSPDYEGTDYEELHSMAPALESGQAAGTQGLDAPAATAGLMQLPHVRDMAQPLEPEPAADGPPVSADAGDAAGAAGKPAGGAPAAAAPPPAAAAAAPAKPGSRWPLRRQAFGQLLRRISKQPEQPPPQQARGQTASVQQQQQQQPPAAAAALAAAQQQQKQQEQPQVPTVDEAREAAAADQRLATQTLPTREPLHASPPPSLRASVAVNTDGGLVQIPQSFLGLSHEWTAVDELDTNPGYKKAVKLLSSFGAGPLIIRVGGRSTDRVTELLPPSMYAALSRVHRATGAKFILGLNFEAGDLALSRRQLTAAQEMLPDDALLTYELGNEPNFYEGKRNLSALEYARTSFTTDWTEYARNLSCPCDSSSCCVDSMFAGPAWGHINVYPSTIKWFLDNAARYVSMATVHFYKATKETPNTAASLLEEAPLRREMDNLKQLVQVSNSFGKPLRLAEMNTISNSGRLGVSNVFAAALWTLDAAFEAAAAGAVGINLHQGAGQNLYTGIVRREVDGVLKPTVLRPAFYGMLLFQQAVGGGAMILTKGGAVGDTGHLKVWPLYDTASGELRFVLINKHATQAATQVLQLAGARGSREHYEPLAKLTRMVARGDDPLAATDGITLGGRYYTAGCEARGRDQALSLDADGAPGSSLTWSVYLPPGSATLLRVTPRAEAV